MNGFLIMLIVVLVVGLTITQLALLKWTDNRLWNLLHICLFLVRNNAQTLIFSVGIGTCIMAGSEKSCSLGPIPIQRLVHENGTP